MTRILFVVPDLDFDRGAVTQFGLLARQLHSGGSPASVAVLGPRGQRTAPWADLVEFPIRFLGQHRLLDLTCWRDLREWIRAEPFDVIHVWGTSALRQLGPVLRRMKVPLLACSLFGEEKPTPMLLRIVDRVLTPTPDLWLSHDHVSRSSDVVKVPPVVTAPSREDDARARAGIPPGGRLIIAAGRLDRPEEHLTAVRTFDYLKYVYPDLSLLLIGDGPAHASLWRWVVGLSRGNVRTHMPRAIPDVGTLLPAADVIWVPNVRRGGTNLVLEGMAAARPVIASRVSHLEPLVQDGNTGLFAEPNDTVSLARVTRRVLDDAAEAKRIGEQASAFVHEEHSPEIVAEMLLKLYAERRTSGSASVGGEQSIKP